MSCFPSQSQPFDRTLARLDAAGVDMWCNKRGWFWATREALKAAVASGDASPARGPFASAVAAGTDAASARGL